MAATGNRLRPLLPVAVVGAFLFTSIGVCVGYPCVSTGLRYGLWLDQCPASDLRLAADVHVQGLVRGDEGGVVVQPVAMFLEDDGPDAGAVREHFRRGARVDLQLLDSEENPVEGVEIGAFESWGGDGLRADVTLPGDLIDGDYVVRAVVSTGFEERSIDVPLALYAPAIAHVVSDRPLYKPGQEVLLRSVLLKRTDMTPLDGRPGRWRITAPDGTEMHTERSKAAAYGVSHTSFPLDRRAEQGTWRAEFVSGDATDAVRFEVKPFKLPRFTVELSPDKTWFASGDTLSVSGVARYASGAPVANAPVVVRLRQAEGRWPMPLDWEEPIEAVTGRDGTFEAEFGEIPSDLIERAVFSVDARVTEEAGEVGGAGAQVVLSEDDLRVEAVTELDGGLVEGFNNRAYLRVMRPDGTPLPLADVVVDNPWDPTAPKRDAKTDEDGVASIQLDPGPPVTVVRPAAPVRQRPLTPQPVQLSSASEMVTGRGLDMAERRALDALHPAIAACGDYAPNGAAVSVGLQVNAFGGVQRVLVGDGALQRCVRDAMGRVRMPASGTGRAYTLSWYVPDSLKPSVNLSTSQTWGSDQGAVAALREQAILARRCLERGQGVSGTLMKVRWGLRKGSTGIELDADTQSGTGLSAAAQGCVRSTLASARLAEPATSDALGGMQVQLSVPVAPGTSKPQPWTTVGYELQVTALPGDPEEGRTRLVLNQGQIPNLRVRATPSLVKAGETVEIALLRGPSWRGDLPEKLYLQEGNRRVGEAELEEGKNTVQFEVPDDVDGFLHVTVAGSRAVLFVQPDKPLALKLGTDKPAYAPGETATLTVTTTAGGDPVAAGVGLIGVDSTLGQLAPLTGPDDWGRVTVRATADQPAFDSFDPRALTLGRVRGENAAKAAVLRISQLPMDEAGDLRTSASNSVTPDVQGALVTNFYAAYEELVRGVRSWEKTAPKGETMQPPTMAKLWKAALKARRDAGEPAVDGWGRELTLDLLPRDLLEQLDPRQLVADGTRLPEDIVSWTGWVDEEVR